MTNILLSTILPLELTMANRKIPSLFDNLDPALKSQFDQLSPTAKERITISEHAFLERYLPMLYNFYTGDISSEDISKFRTLWINEVAKSGYNEVLVVDQAGNTVQVVPPVLGRVQYSHKDRNFSISAVMGSYGQLKRMRPKMATDILKGGIGNALVNRSAPVDGRWQKLFEYYKCAPVDTQAEVAPQASIGFDPDELTYEP